MNMFFLLLRLIQPAWQPDVAHAQIGPTITTVGGNLVTVFAGAGYSSGAPGIAGAVVGVMWAVILPVGTFLIVRAGISLIVSQEEDKLSKAKRTIASTLIGIILVFISQQLVASFVSFGGGTGILDGGQTTLQNTVYGLLNWALVTMAALGAVIIVVSVARGIASFGKEESIKNMRQTIAGTATGMLLISLIPAIKLTLGIVDLQPLGEGAFNADATQIILTGTHIVANLLLYLALLAVVIVIYAGIRMIVHFGNDEEFTKSRQLIVRALIGLLIIFLSYVLTVFLINLVVPNSGAGGTTTTTTTGP